MAKERFEKEIFKRELINLIEKYMKSSKIKLMMFSALCVGSVTFAQTTDTNTEKTITVGEVATKEDNAAIVAANKKRAAEEKAKLPKPYDATENAEAKIAELVKKAKKVVVLNPSKKKLEGFSFKKSEILLKKIPQKKILRDFHEKINK